MVFLSVLSKLCGKPEIKFLIATLMRDPTKKFKEIKK
jgi:hypothetical protein